ncbi:hypothetical protein C8R46DRAFT_382387 [Mycena filopes]|nr:hypothetical protein C8R46DRAFT_382387 [Mycena filopes]
MMDQKQAVLIPNRDLMKKISNMYAEFKDKSTPPPFDELFSVPAKGWSYVVLPLDMDLRSHIFRQTLKSVSTDEASATYESTGKYEEHKYPFSDLHMYTHANPLCAIWHAGVELTRFSIIEHRNMQAMLEVDAPELAESLSEIFALYKMWVLSPEQAQGTEPATVAPVVSTQKPLKRLILKPDAPLPSSGDDSTTGSPDGTVEPGPAPSIAASTSAADDDGFPPESESGSILSTPTDRPPSSALSVPVTIRTPPRKTKSEGTRKRKKVSVSPQAADQPSSAPDISPRGPLPQKRKIEVDGGASPTASAQSFRSGHPGARSEFGTAPTKPVRPSYGPGPSSSRGELGRNRAVKSGTLIPSEELDAGRPRVVRRRDGATGEQTARSSHSMASSHTSNSRTGQSTFGGGQRDLGMTSRPVKAATTSGSALSGVNRGGNSGNQTSTSQRAGSFHPQTLPGASTTHSPTMSAPSFYGPPTIQGSRGGGSGSQGSGRALAPPDSEGLSRNHASTSQRAGSNRPGSSSSMHPPSMSAPRPDERPAMQGSRIGSGSQGSAARGGELALEPPHNEGSSGNHASSSQHARGNRPGATSRHSASMSASSRDGHPAMQGNRGSGSGSQFTATHQQEGVPAPPDNGGSSSHRSQSTSNKSGVTKLDTTKFKNISKKD